MGASTQISLAEYLETSYRPDREYVRGEVRERNVGKWEHARVQALLAIWFGNHEAEWNIKVSTDQRVQISDLDCRVPDLVLVGPGSHPPILATPPILVVEVLSVGDSYSDTQERARDYVNMGVGVLWIVDPQTRTGRVCTGLEWREARTLTVPGTPIFVVLDDIFSRI